MNLLKYQIFSKVVEIGTVKIGTFSSVSIQWMPQIIKQFQNQFPHIEIKLLDGNYSEIEEWIADGTADLGFVNLPSKYTPEMILSHLPDNVCYRPLEGEHYRSIGIAAASIKNASPAAKKLIEFITEWITQRAQPSALP